MQQQTTTNPVTPEVKKDTAMPNGVKPKETPALSTQAPATAPAPSHLKAADILKRTGMTSNEVPASNDAPSNPSDFEGITDPNARRILEEKIKNLESGYNKKYQQVAEMKKDLERQSQANDRWTPEKLQQYLNREDFVQAAQALQQRSAPREWTGSSEEWSALTDGEKQQFSEMNQRLHRQESQMNQMLKLREDEMLKQQYPDYEPATVDKLMNDLISGSYQATRADVWKVANFESAVERAYRMGQEDAAKAREERGNPVSLSSNGMNVTPADDIPADVRQSGFGAIAKFRLSQLKNLKGK